MISAIIIDDEKHWVEKLEDLLKDHCAGSINIVQTAQSCEEGVKAVLRHRPQLVFLDVHLKDGTGFDVLNQVKFMSLDVIFTTAYDKYAIRALRFNAIDYLLKPFNDDELINAVQRASKKVFKDQRDERWDPLLGYLNNEVPRLPIAGSKGLKFVSICDIIRCEAIINCTAFFLNDGTKITATKTLLEYEELLGEYKFYRIDRSHLINIRFVEKYFNKGQGGIVVMKDGTEVNVAARRKKWFLELIHADPNIKFPSK